MSGTFDVAVLGAGPAGTSAARVAAAAGARVVIVDRADFPRYKTCGGGIVGISADAAGIDLAPLTRASVDTVTFSLGGRFAVTRRTRDRRRLLSLVMRTEFDAALLDVARAAGAEIRTATTVTGLREDGDAVEVAIRGGEPVRARVVVGADGSAGRTAAYVGVRCDQVDLGLEGEFPATAAQRSAWQGRLLLDWGPVPGSYGWVFPKGDVLTVGVIGARGEGDGLRAYYRDLVARLDLTGVAPDVESGHLTKVRAPDSPLRRGRVLVAGDAAGLLEPWTREGISYALRSGRLAGAAAAACASGDAETALAAYPRQVAEVLGPEIDAGRVTLELFTRHPAVFHTLVASLPGGFGLFERLVDGRTTVAAQLRRPGVPRLARLIGLTPG